MDVKVLLDCYETAIRLLRLDMRVLSLQTEGAEPETPERIAYCQQRKQDQLRRAEAAGLLPHAEEG